MCRERYSRCVHAPCSVHVQTEMNVPVFPVLTWHNEHNVTVVRSSRNIKHKIKSNVMLMYESIAQSSSFIPNFVCAISNVWTFANAKFIDCTICVCASAIGSNSGGFRHISIETASPRPQLKIIRKVLIFVQTGRTDNNNNKRKILPLFTFCVNDVADAA